MVVSENMPLGAKLEKYHQPYFLVILHLSLGFTLYDRIVNEILNNRHISDI